MVMRVLSAAIVANYERSTIEGIKLIHCCLWKMNVKADHKY